MQRQRKTAHLQCDLMTHTLRHENRGWVCQTCTQGWQGLCSTGWWWCEGGGRVMVNKGEDDISNCNKATGLCIKLNLSLNGLESPGLRLADIECVLHKSKCDSFQLVFLAITLFFFSWRFMCPDFVQNQDGGQWTWIAVDLSRSSSPHTLNREAVWRGPKNKISEKLWTKLMNAYRTCKIFQLAEISESRWQCCIGLVSKSRLARFILICLSNGINATFIDQTAFQDKTSQPK